MLQLGQGRVLQAQVAGYTVDGLPEVFLYATIGPDVSSGWGREINELGLRLIIVFSALQNIAFINQELVAQGHAEWMEDDEEEEEGEQVVEEQQSAAAVLA